MMLGTQQLYKFEASYAEILVDHPDAPMSQVYWASHLLRLFLELEQCWSIHLWIRMALLYF